MMPKWLTDLLIIALCVIAFIAGCEFKKSNDTSVVYDTLSVKSDTIFVHVVDTISKFNVIKSVKYVNQNQIDTSDSVTNTGLSSDDCDSIRTYQQYNRDSSIVVTSLVHGIMLRQVIDGKVSTITNTVTVDKTAQCAIYGTISFGIGTLSPSVTIVRQKSAYTLGYNLLQKTPVIGYSIRLFQR